MKFNLNRSLKWKEFTPREKLIWVKSFLEITDSTAELDMDIVDDYLVPWLAVRGSDKLYDLALEKITQREFTVDDLELAASYSEEESLARVLIDRYFEALYIIA